MINKIEIKNFKGIKNKIIEFGEKTHICGANATGKSTIIDAYNWCLFGKNAAGDATTEWVKPIIDGEQQRGIDTSVTVTLGGVEYTRTQKEKWVKKRGETEREYSGNTTVFEIDGVPKKKSEFAAIIKEKIGEAEDIRIMTTIGEFLKIDWKKRREILIGSGDLSTIQADIDNKKASLRKTNKQVEELQAKLEEVAETARPDEYEEATTKLEQINAEIAKTTAEIAATESNNGKALKVQKIKSELELLKKDLEAARLKDTEALREEIATIKNKLLNIGSERAAEKAKFEAKKQEAKNKKDKLDFEVEKLNQRIEEEKKQLEELREKKSALAEEYIAERMKEYETVGVCSCCGQELPEEAKKEHRERFNITKAEKLEQITNKGLSIKNKIEEKDAILKNLEKDKTAALGEALSIEITDEYKEHGKTPEELELENKIKELQNKLDEAKNNPGKEERKIHEKIKEKDEELQNTEQEATSDDTEELKETLAKLKEERTAAQQKQNEEFQAKEQNARLKELQKAHKDTAETAAALEREIDKAEEKLKKEIETQEKELSDRFKMTKWKLYEQQINGGVKPVCKAYFNGVEYNHLNTAAKINIGLDIAETLCKERGLDLPIFIDNAEAVNNINETEMQTIEFRVTTDPELKTEIIK